MNQVSLQEDSEPKDRASEETGEEQISRFDNPWHSSTFEGCKGGTASDPHRLLCVSQNVRF